MQSIESCVISFHPFSVFFCGKWLYAYEKKKNSSMPTRSPSAAPVQE